MQIPILNGIFTDILPDVRISYPRNLVPIYTPQGASNGYLRPADGIIEIADTRGIDRAGILWENTHYRVSGDALISVSDTGVITSIGPVGDNRKFATLFPSFDYLGITSNLDFFLYDGTTLTEVTDPDLGDPIDHIWIDGYFMLTDGEFVVVTELDDPFSVLPFKYASSEVSPDPIVAIQKVHNEAYIINRFSIEIFENIGGSGFPFQRIEGAHNEQGAVGTKACCVFNDDVFMIGGSENEAVAFWVVNRGNSTKLSTREIDKVLDDYEESVLADILVEPKSEKGQEQIYIHLPDRTLVYDITVSKQLPDQAWFILNSGQNETDKYRARNMVYVNNEFWVGDTQTTKIGKLTDALGEHWGDPVTWQFGITIIYNEALGAIFHELELISLSHETTKSLNSTITTEYSDDGNIWSIGRDITTQTPDGRNKNLTWLAQGSMRNWRIQRFRGTSASRLSFIRLEARLEGLNV